MAQNSGTKINLVSGNMDQNLRNPSCLILSHPECVLCFFGFFFSEVSSRIPIEAGNSGG